uniref:Uncharacterized protein n=1 Tax=Arundo donax TaxID=35708 RepID=A0A0A9E1Q4_ARUDO
MLKMILRNSRRSL